MDASSNPTADKAAILIVKLIMDLDELILGLRSGIPQAKPWQRQLHALLGQADQQMQVLRMTEVMGKRGLTTLCSPVTAAGMLG